MIIGILPDPEHHQDWPVIKAMLEPAAKRGGVPILEQHEEVWVAAENGALMAAATGRILPEDGIGEVVLVGGIERERWLSELSGLMACWFRDEGMKAMRAYGRKGWKRELERIGWRAIGEQDGVTAYERALDVEEE